jgi:uncharacterized Zn-finger protein
MNMLAKYEPGAASQPSTVDMEHVRVQSVYNNLVNIQPIQLQVEIFPNPHGIPATITTTSVPVNAQQLQQLQAAQASAPAADQPATSTKQHVCKICTKTFTTAGNLNLHFKIHSGETGEKTHESRGVDVSSWITGEKPFKCQTCGKGFIQSNNLSTHQKTHSGEKPYECSVCKKCFSQSNNLKVGYLFICHQFDS